MWSFSLKKFSVPQNSLTLAQLHHLTPGKIGEAIRLSLHLCSLVLQTEIVATFVKAWQICNWTWVSKVGDFGALENLPSPWESIPTMASVHICCTNKNTAINCSFANHFPCANGIINCTMSKLNNLCVTLQNNRKLFSVNHLSQTTQLGIWQLVQTH